MDKPKTRGAGQPPRKYTKMEWVKGYTAWVLLLPVYLMLWFLATFVKRVPPYFLARLRYSWFTTVESRKNDVRIPGDPSIPAYMLRWWKIKRNAFFNVYYHLVRRSDDDTALHDHPWWSFSIVLDGGYFEHTIADGGIHTKTWVPAGTMLFRRAGTKAHRLELDVTDRCPPDPWVAGERQDTAIVLPNGGYESPVRTIFITGPVLRRWGFHHTDAWVDAYDWDAYLASKGIVSMKMAGYADQLKKG